MTIAVGTRPPSRSVSHYFLLDLLRGLASMAVLVWHYQHMFLAETGRWSEGYERQYQPLYPLLKVLYEHGGTGVQFFYLLSGAVFAHVYADTLAEGRTGPREFAVRRFARLYPLHFATLLAVLVMQYAFLAENGRFFVYQINDFKHFFLNLVMATHWGFQDGHSFNAPFWSVSVELVSYVAFLGLCVAARPRGRVRQLLLYVSVAACMLAFQKLGFGSKTQFHLGQGLLGFFLGAAIFTASGFVTHRAVLAILAVGALAVAIWKFDIHRGMFGGIIPFGLLFPTILLAGIALEPWVGRFCRHVRWIGDISYSTYLVHFPVQLAIAVMCAYFVDINFYRVDVFLMLNIGTLGIALLVHRFYERPAQRVVLERLLGPRP